MSLITDLLAKVKKQEPRRDIPPILKDEVLQSKSERRSRRWLTGILVLTGVLIAAGFGLIYVVESMKGPSLLVSAPPQGAPPVQSAPQATAPAPPPQADTGTSAKKYAHKSLPHASDRVQEMRREKTVAGEHAALEKPTGSMTRQERDMNLYMARTYETQKNYRQALMHYRRVLAVEPNNYVVMNNIASMLIYLGSCEEAIGYAQKALDVKRSYVFSLINLGISYGCLGKKSESESYFRRALAIEPSNHHALLNLGLLYEKQNAFDSADRYYRRLSEGENIQGYLGLARIAEKQRKIDDAVRFYKVAISMENIDPHTAAMVNERLIQLTK